jgi:hypothetical protein
VGRTATPGYSTRGASEQAPGGETRGAAHDFVDTSPRPLASARGTLGEHCRTKIALQGAPQRRGAGDPQPSEARPIGVLEAGAQVYIMETAAGWTNVLPKKLHILPPEEGGFWIPASDVPK